MAWQCFLIIRVLCLKNVSLCYTSPTMNTNELITALLDSVSLNHADVARLVLEAHDYLEDMVQEKSRTEVLCMLRSVIRYGAQTLREEGYSVSLREAARSSLKARQHLRPTTRRDLRFYTRRLLSIAEFADVPLNHFNARRCRQLLDMAFSGTPSGYIKGRNILHSIFAHGVRLEWCSRNPVDLIRVPKPKEKPIRPLSLHEVERLKRTAERPAFRDMKFSLSLMLYCGVRPTEITRIQQADIDWEEGHVIIRPHTSKTGGGRVVPLRCVRGIRAGERSIPRNWVRRWKKLRLAAGFRKWTPDICRHTFASYHAAFFKDLPALQLEMGHRDTMLLRTRYVSPACRNDARRFWRHADFTLREPEPAAAATCAPAGGHGVTPQGPPCRA